MLAPGRIAHADGLAELGTVGYNEPTQAVGCKMLFELMLKDSSKTRKAHDHERESANDSVVSIPALGYALSCKACLLRD